MRKTTIIMVTECPYAGIWRAIISNAKMFKDLGFNIQLVVPKKDRDRYGETVEDNITQFSNIGTVHRVRMKKDYISLKRNKQALLDLFTSLDDFMIISYGSYAGKVARYLFKDGAIKCLYHVPQCIDIKRMSLKFKIIEAIFERYLTNYATGYLACSPSEAYNLINTYGVQPQKVILCPNYIVSDKTTPEIGDKETRKYPFVYVGRLVRSKGIDTVLMAFQKIGRAKDIIVIGDGPDRVFLEKKHPDVMFTGNVSNDNVFKYLDNTQFIVSNSVVEGLPFSILEAMSRGVIPILSDVDGHNDLVIHSRNGFLFHGESELINILFKTGYLSGSYLQELSKNAIQVPRLCYTLARDNMKKHFSHYA